MSKYYENSTFQCLLLINSILDHCMLAYLFHSNLSTTIYFMQCNLLNLLFGLSNFDQLIFYFMASYGYMRFKRPLTQREQQIMDQNLGSIVEIDDWWMAEGQYNYDQFWRVFEVCEEITAKAIDLNQNERKQVIHDLIHIKFPNLTAINFSTNNIESISDLQYLEAPVLEYLTLTFNSVSDLKTLAKCFFPNLKGLYLHSNKAVSLDWLPQLTTACSLDFLTLQYQQNEETVIEQNFSMLFKLSAKTIKKIRIFKLTHNGHPKTQQKTKFNGQCWQRSILTCFSTNTQLTPIDSPQFENFHITKTNQQFQRDFWYYYVLNKLFQEERQQRFSSEIIQMES